MAPSDIEFVTLRVEFCDNVVPALMTDDGVDVFELVMFALDKEPD